MALTGRQICGEIKYTPYYRYTSQSETVRSILGLCCASDNPNNAADVELIKALQR